MSVYFRLFSYHPVADPDGHETDEEDAEIPDHLGPVGGHEEGRQFVGDGVDLVAGADEDERRQQDVHHGVVGDQDQHA